MLKDSTYKEKLTMVKQWMPSIVEGVKKDLKNDHLKNDWNFTKKYFKTKNINKLTPVELVEGYTAALEEEEGAEAIAEFIANRWLLKHSDVYHHFEEKLKSLTADFNELTALDPAFAQELVDSASQSFGTLQTYLFSVFNSVVLPEELFKALDERARTEADEQAHKALQAQDELSWKAKVNALEQQISRLTEKYEKKLLGLERKYHNDTKTLKKQISSLQQKMAQKG